MDNENDDLTRLLEHERARLHSLVDAFVDGFTEESVPEDYSDFRIDVAGLVMILVGLDEDDDEIETAWSRFETSRPWQKVGILHSCLSQLEGPDPDPD